MKVRPFNDLGGPGFWLTTDELAWKAYRRYKDTGRVFSKEELLSEDEASAHDIEVCKWIVRFVEDMDIDPITLQRDT